MIIKNVNPYRLNDEFFKNGIKVTAMTFKDDTATVLFDDNVDMTKVNEIISKHNPEPIPQTPNQLELLQKAVDDLIMGGI